GAAIELRADLGCVQHVRSGATRLFACFVALGSPCDWVRMAESAWLAPLKRAGAALCYPLCSLAVILRNRSVSFEASVDGGERVARRDFAWFAAKARHLGGGLDLGDAVRLDSGRLALVEVSAQSRGAL